MNQLFRGLIIFSMLYGVVFAEDHPLDQISKDVDLVIRIKSFESSVKHIADLANQIQPGTGDLISQNATAFGLVLSNPAMTGVDQSKDFYLFLFAREDGEPKALFAIPTTDGAALQSGLPKNFVSEVRENWVYYADADHGVPPAVTGSTTLAQSLKGSAAESLWNESDIGIHLNVDHLTSVYSTKIQEGRRHLEDQLQKGVNTPDIPNPAETVALLKAELDIAMQVLEDMDTLTIGLTASEAGLSIIDQAQFAAGSEVDRFLESHPKSDFKALSRLSPGRPLYLGFSGDTSKFARLALEIAGPLQSNPSLLQALNNDIQLLNKSKLKSIVSSFDIQEGANGLFSTSMVVDTKDAAEMLSTTRTMLASMNSMKIGKMEQQTTLASEAETIGTRKVDVITVKQTFDGSDPQTAAQEKILKVMFGKNGMQSRLVALADGFLQVQGGGQPAMEAALKAYDANTNQLTEQRSGLAAEANALLLFDLSTLVKNGLRAAASVPDLPLPFSKSAIESLDITSSYIGTTAVIENHGVSVVTHIPTAQFQGIMKLAMFFQTQR